MSLMSLLAFGSLTFLPFLGPATSSVCSWTASVPPCPCPWSSIGRNSYG